MLTILHLDGVLRCYDDTGKRVAVPIHAPSPAIVLTQARPPSAYVHEANERYKAGQGRVLTKLDCAPIPGDDEGER